MFKKWKTSLSRESKKHDGSYQFEAFWDNACNQYTNYGIPTVFYKSILSKQQRQDRLDPVSLYNDSTYNSATKVRFVCTSDTHNFTDRYPLPMPYGDVLLHAGDFTQAEPHQVQEFTGWLDSLPHPIKIVIAGNHELWLDSGKYGGKSSKYPSSIRDVTVGRLQRSCVYLEDNTAIVHGIKIFGSPWIPEYSGKWGFELRRGDECIEKWREIPSDTDILLTHTPPVGHGDRCTSGLRVGCVSLLQQIQVRVKPLYHVFGHIHEDCGVTTDGSTIFINCALCTEKMKPVQNPVVFDVDKKSDETLLVSSSAEWNVFDPRKKRGSDLNKFSACPRCGFIRANNWARDQVFNDLLGE